MSVKTFPQTVPSHETKGDKIPKFATLAEWETYIGKKTTAGEKLSPEEYAGAAKAAFSENNHILTIVWFEEAKNAGYSDAEMYSILADCSRQLKDRQGEISSIAFYVKNFPDAPRAGYFRERMFEISCSEKNDEKIGQSWIAMDDSSRTKELFLNQFFLQQKGKNRKESCDSLAQKLLKVNPKHVAALEWLGEKYYWIGENLFVQSNKNYEQNKTSLNYLKLTRDFEVVSTNFNKALTYFNVLWETDHSPRYASFLANIHNRFKNKQKSDYYRSFIK